MKVDIYHSTRTELNGKLIHTSLIYMGYAEVEEFDAQKIFDLCNWSCWAEEKPTNLHADIDYCDHGLCLINPETQEWWLSKSVGWLVGDRNTVDNYVNTNRYNLLWK